MADYGFMTSLDPNRLKALQAQQFAPYLRESRSNVQRALSQAGSMAGSSGQYNDAVRAALAGAGEGLSKAGQSAANAALGQATTEAGLANQAAGAQFQADENVKRMLLGSLLQSADFSKLNTGGVTSFSDLLSKLQGGSANISDLFKQTSTTNPYGDYGSSQVWKYIGRP